MLGAGPMGLMLCSLLVAQGRSVTIADRHLGRLEQARELGARGMQRLGQHELVFEAMGRPEAWRQAAHAASPGGVAVLVGGCRGGTEVTFTSGPIHYDELEVRGAFHHSPAEVDAALETLALDKVNWRMLRGETIGLERLPDAVPSGGRARKWVVDPRL